MKQFLVFQLSILFAFAALANNKLPQTGYASYYGDRVNHHRVACGERYCKDSFTAAHRSLPFGTFIKVTNLKNNKTVIVRINDRGPRRKNRIVDLSKAAARQLDFVSAGLTRVRIDIASDSEINGQRCICAPLDSAIVKDSAGNTVKMAMVKDSFPPDMFKIQGGAFATLKGAAAVKNYLVAQGVDNVTIKAKKTRRRRHSHVLYKVIIGPMDEAAKQKVLAILKNKGIPGLVIRL